MVDSVSLARAVIHRAYDDFRHSPCPDPDLFPFLVGSGDSSVWFSLAGMKPYPPSYLRTINPFFGG